MHQSKRIQHQKWALWLCLSNFGGFFLLFFLVKVLGYGLKPTVSDSVEFGWCSASESLDLASFPPRMQAALKHVINHPSLVTLDNRGEISIQVESPQKLVQLIWVGWACLINHWQVLESFESFGLSFDNEDMTCSKKA